MHLPGDCILRSNLPVKLLACHSLDLLVLMAFHDVVRTKPHPESLMKAAVGVTSRNGTLRTLTIFFDSKKLTGFTDAASVAKRPFSDESSEGIQNGVSGVKTCPNTCLKISVRLKTEPRNASRFYAKCLAYIKFLFLR